jgi:cytochrome b561
MMTNSDSRYGWVTKALHWLLFVLLLHQFCAAWAMLHTPDGETTAGLTQGSLYEWHKSIGLVALLAASARYLWRRLTPLPDWAPNLTAVEKRTIDIVERVLYTCMFVMPVSGFLFVMAGGFGVRLFDRWELPNVVGTHEWLAHAAEWTHEGSATLLALALVVHWVVIIRHQQVHKDRYVNRMLPFTHQQ